MKRMFMYAKEVMRIRATAMDAIDEVKAEELDCAETLIKLDIAFDAMCASFNVVRNLAYSDDDVTADDMDVIEFLIDNSFCRFNERKAYCEV